MKKVSYHISKDIRKCSQQSLACNQNHFEFKKVNKQGKKVHIYFFIKLTPPSLKTRHVCHWRYW